MVSKTHCSAQNGGADGRPLGAQVRAQKLDWLVVEEITQLGMALWADLACVGLNADVKFLLLGDFRQLPAVLDSWAGRPRSEAGQRHAAEEPGAPAFFLVFWAHSPAVSLNFKNKEEGHRPLFSFFWRIPETGSDDGRRGPVTLRHMRFRLTDLDGNVVRLRGSSLSFVLYLDHV